MEFYCISCMQHYEEKHFSLWLNDKSKARRCNGCHDSDIVKERMRKNQAEKKDKPAPVNPILTKLSETFGAKHKRKVKDRLADYQDRKQLHDDFEL